MKFTAEQNLRFFHYDVAIMLRASRKSRNFLHDPVPLKISMKSKLPQSILDRGSTLGSSRYVNFSSKSSSLENPGNNFEGCLPEKMTTSNIHRSSGFVELRQQNSSNPVRWKIVCACVYVWVRFSVLSNTHTHTQEKKNRHRLNTRSEPNEAMKHFFSI